MDVEYVSIHSYICILHACKYVYMYMHTLYMHGYIHTHVSLPTYIPTFIQKYMHACTHRYAQVPTQHSTCALTAEYKSLLAYLFIHICLMFKTCAYII